jgi:hypothetical protein
VLSVKDHIIAESSRSSARSTSAFVWIGKVEHSDQRHGMTVDWADQGSIGAVGETNQAQQEGGCDNRQ